MNSSDEKIQVLAESLWQLWRIWTTRSDMPEKLSAEQYWVLTTLVAGSTMTVSALARQRGVTTAAMTMATKKMEAAGWVHRFRSPENQRKVLVQPTEQGRDLWGRVRVARQRALGDLFHRLSPQEQDVLLHIVWKMRGSTDAGQPSADRSPGGI